MRKCRSAGHRSRHAALWRRLALAAAVFCLCWHLADCIEDAMWPAMREVAQHECRSLVVQCLNTAVYIGRALSVIILLCSYYVEQVERIGIAVFRI